MLLRFFWSCTLFGQWNIPTQTTRSILHVFCIIWATFPKNESWHTVRVIFKDYGMSTKRQKFCSVGLSKAWTNISSAGWTVGSNRIREEKKRALKINFITARRLCSRLAFITSLVGKMPQLCLQLICLSSHSSLRMLMRGSSTIHLNPRDQCEYLETDERNGAD